MSNTGSTLKPLRLQRGQIKHKILVALSEQPSLTGTNLFSLFKRICQQNTTEQFVSNHLELMFVAGFVEKRAQGAWAISSDGLALIRSLDQVKPSIEVVKANLYRSTSGTYDGKELRNTSVRPGAYDAYKLPSIMGGKLVPSNHASD